MFHKLSNLSSTPSSARKVKSNVLRAMTYQWELKKRKGEMTGLTEYSDVYVATSNDKRPQTYGASGLVNHRVKRYIHVNGLVSLA